MVEKRIISQQAKIKEKKFSKQSLDKFASALQHSINKKYKIQYLD